MNTTQSRLTAMLSRQKRSLRADLLMALTLIAGLVTSAAPIL